MRLVFGLVLIAGLGLAGFAVYMAQNYIGAYETALQQARAQSSASVPVTEVYVATRPIAYGEEITSEDVRLAPWPDEILPEDAFTADMPLNADGAPYRVALRRIEQFEAILPVKVSEPGGSAGLTSHLEPGESAFAIKVDVASGVSGFLRPGHHVDVYWTGRVDALGPDSPSGNVTQLIQTGLRLIAIDQSADLDNAETTIARTVTVAASREQVAKLTYAQQTGTLTLSLISGDAAGDAERIEVDQLSMLGIERAERQEAAAPAPARNCVTVRRAGAPSTDACTN
jgi:pilus assembly protein CpaB